MLVTTESIKAGTRAHYEGDKIVVVHAAEVSGVLKVNQELRKDHANGFTNGRTMRLIGVVDNLAYFAMIKKYPEIQTGTPAEKKKAWKKAFADPEFSGYKAVEGGI